LRDWLEIAGPALHRKPKTNGAGEPVDPFLALAQRQGLHVPIDVEARLRDMRYQGPGDSGIHATQLSVSASLLSRGKSVESVVATLLNATRVVAGSFGENWDWRHEERTIRAVCETWLAKHPFETRPDPETHTLPPLKEAEISDKASRGKASGRPEAIAEPGSEPTEQLEPAEEAADGGSAAAATPAGSAPSQPRTASHTRLMVRIIAGQLPNAVTQSERALIDAGFQIFVRGTLMYLVTAGTAHAVEHIQPYNCAGSLTVGTGKGIEEGAQPPSRLEPRRQGDAVRYPAGPTVPRRRQAVCRDRRRRTLLDNHVHRS
jgi:hypothetical protein